MGDEGEAQSVALALSVDGMAEEMGRENVISASAMRLTRAHLPFLGTILDGYGATKIRGYCPKSEELTHL